MESNKLLIGVQFNDEQGASIVMELIVLRDITLKQLLDGIKYGLVKKGNGDVYRICGNIYVNCLKAVDPDGSKILLGNYTTVIIHNITVNNS